MPFNLNHIQSRLAHAASRIPLVYRVLCFLVLALSSLGLPIPPAQAGTKDEILSTYQHFAEAQNTRQPEAIGAFFWDSPDFLWVSDGKSIWGRAAVLERMGKFQTLEVWRVMPLIDRARVVEVGADAAYLHMPLDLALGTKAEPAVTRFLVSLLFKKVGGQWKIAALFTTLDNP